MRTGFPERPVSSRRRFVPLLLIGVVLALLSAACSEEAQEGIRDAVEESERAPSDGADEEAADEPAAEEPPAEEPAEPEAPEETPEEPAVNEEGLSGQDWLIIAVIGVAAFTLILAATSWSASRSKKKEAARASFNRSLDQVIGGSRWVHGQGSIEVMAVTRPEQLQPIWNSTRARIVDVEADIAVMAAGVANPQLHDSLVHLGNSLTELRGALDSNVSVRLDTSPGREYLVQSSDQAVNDHRAQLLAAIAPVASARQ